MDPYAWTHTLTPPSRTHDVPPHVVRGQTAARRRRRLTKAPPRGRLWGWGWGGANARNAWGRPGETWHDRHRRRRRIVRSPHERDPTPRGAPRHRSHRTGSRPAPRPVSPRGRRDAPWGGFEDTVGTCNEDAYGGRHAPPRPPTRPPRDPRPARTGRHAAPVLRTRFMPRTGRERGLGERRAGMRSEAKTERAKLTHREISSRWADAHFSA